jgi:hypothetical protein
VSDHHDRLGAEHRDAVFQAGDHFRRRDIAGDAGHENVADALVE